MVTRTLVLCAALVFSSIVLAGDQTRLRTSPLTIETASGAHRFTVEMALSESERRRGLMYREKLGDDEGMLFLFDRDEVITMWMKNTRLALDMVFIAADGTVVSLAENAVPGSLEIIGSGIPARAVLEIKAGTANRQQIKPGSIVRNILFSNGRE